MRALTFNLFLGTNSYAKLLDPLRNRNPFYLKQFRFCLDNSKHIAIHNWFRQSLVWTTLSFKWKKVFKSCLWNQSKAEELARQLLILRNPRFGSECIWMSNTASSPQIFLDFFSCIEEPIIKSCELQTSPGDCNTRFILEQPLTRLVPGKKRTLWILTFRRTTLMAVSIAIDLRGIETYR